MSTLLESFSPLKSPRRSKLLTNSYGLSKHRSKLDQPVDWVYLLSIHIEYRGHCSIFIQTVANPCLKAWAGLSITYVHTVCIRTVSDALKRTDSNIGPSQDRSRCKWSAIDLPKSVPVGLSNYSAVVHRARSRLQNMGSIL